MTSGQAGKGRKEPPGAGLQGLRSRLALVKAATLLALEGKTRATVTELLDRSEDEETLELSPGEAGQILSSLGLRRLTSHGRSRLELDPVKLGRIRHEVDLEITAQEERYTQEQVRLIALTQRVERLTQQAEAIKDLIDREGILRAYLQRHIPPQVGYSGPGSASFRGQAGSILQYRVTRLQQEVAQVQKLEAAIKEMEGKVAGKAALEARRRKLAEEAAKVTEAEATLAKGEASQAQRKVQHAKRLQEYRYTSGVMRLAEVEQAVAAGRVELEQLSRQLGEKRSLLGKLFGKKETGA